jgi:cytochrome c peroxidase
MRNLNWLWIAGAPALIAGCAIGSEPRTGKAIAQPLVLTDGVHVSTEGILDYGTVVFAENPTTLLEAGDLHGYEFDGKAGGVITITMNAAGCGTPDTTLDLFGPEDASGARVELAANDDAELASCFTDSQIQSFTLPVDGRYFVVASSYLQAGGGHYRLQLSCDNAACALPGAPTFQGSRIAQTDIDHGVFTPDELFEIGDFTFETIFRVEDGMGNALTGAPANTTPRPNFRQFPNNVHFAAFGAPEAQSCVTCHNVGGDDGAGDLNHNIFQIGDGINRASGVPRNPPTVLGNGFRQQIGIEMTNDLKAELAAAKAAALASQAPVTQPLSSKGISFGSLVANPDGTVNLAGVVGVDTDLVIKPFGWKGREATIRRFIEGGFRVHFGMQTSPSIAKHCANPNVNTFGNGPDCQDPDGDGVKDEIPEGLLTAEAIYMGLRETPVRVPAATAAAQARANAGEALFSQIGCNTCHTPSLTLNSPIHVEPADTTGGAGITVNLAIDNKDPKPAQNADGTTTVEAFSDYKRHDVGAALADSKNFNQIAANQFITPPLWGIAVSAPYLHDGRAPTLADAILAHAGDALAVRNAYAALTADQQSQIVEFLGTLGRAETASAPPVDLSNYVIEQAHSLINFTIPAGTQVPHGGYLIVGRNATKAEFQSFYGKVLDTNVVYVNSATAVRFPIIDGSETFTLAVPGDDFDIDGPSAAMPAGGQKILSRTSCAAPAGDPASWTTAPAAAANATPGAGPLSTGQNRICITEFADATSRNFEYVEIFVE